MTDISTKKTIEIWDDRASMRWVCVPEDGFVVLHEESLGTQSVKIGFPVDAIGPLCKALHEVAQNVIENTRDDDAEG